ncbi:flavodoxin family protein [Marinobacter sp. ELB17]|uniref:flavodoxin family protein n=1 Tax=Marinobacter sp. ELB17 TaxID=270374 RepID=UPI0000F37503|nr:NAD(P)H-dependent oxidoreductase [Marinobacter sp. ELB17]EBA00781.1 hypothetical protein MELB17_23130 [Marinobacter sp. ELB17]
MADFADISALFVNTSLQNKEDESHTRLLLNASAAIMKKNGVAVEHLQLAAHEVPPGVYPDMSEHGRAIDEWPAIWEKVKAADILIVGTPLWLGEESSICRVLIERLYAMSGQLNEKGAINILWQSRRMRHHQQRRRDQAHCDDNRICAQPFGLHNPTPSRLWMDWRGGSWTLLW